MLRTALAEKLTSGDSLYEQLLALPESVVGEIIAGQLYTQARPAGRHTLAHSGLHGEIDGPFQKGRGGPGNWWILIEPEIHFVRDQEVVVPDLAGWRRERMPTLPEDHRFEITPDWVCEVLSPSTARKDRALKMPLYARFGVPDLWLLDPMARTLEAFELRDGHWVLEVVFQNEEMVAAAPFAAAPFSLAVLWG
ncbi:MAG TPA: Uma2 family endonuclease [Candidatus Competibacteraceae bacterium]|nr:Uma2 family endonuclease [Candidatus Competibacteraceae bacterium]HRZ05081.1 Uma2 family endonuclease [Candidatus Competibacteraceae bacterium]HSA47407.1 Uma2 family endonuclease [Candidatus Competibacteraceae bacterium]